MELSLILVLVAIFVVAFLYASVGHGGASGYIAIMAISGFAIETIKPTALILNILVSLIAFISYYKQGYFNVKIFWPLVIASVPLAFLGGMNQLDDRIIKLILGTLLLIPAVRFSGFFIAKNEQKTRPTSTMGLLLAGGSIGYISGLTGIGGGIILSPILLLLHWSKMKQTAALSAGFIFLNSIAGLSGMITHGIHLDAHMAIYIVLALSGGVIGARMGSEKINPALLSKILGLVLFIASLKLLFT